MLDKQIIISNNLCEKQHEIILDTLKLFPTGTEFSVALIENGKVKFFGVRKEEERPKTIQNEDSIFDIASITKLFTATILSNLIVDKKINLDHNINDYISTPVHNDEKIGFRSLANHTSGLPEDPCVIDFDENSGSPFLFFDESKYIHYLQNDLTLDPSKKGTFSYSNIGFRILGQTISEIENKAFPELLDAYVFFKYAMKQTTIDRNQVLDKLVSGRDSKGNKRTPWESSYFSAGGVLSSTSDLSKFVIAQFDKSDKALQLSHESTFEIDERLEWSIGWGVKKTEAGKKYHFHGGAEVGHKSMLIIDLASKNGVVILSNVSLYHEHSVSISELALELIELF